MAKGTRKTDPEIIAKLNKFKFNKVRAAELNRNLKTWNTFIQWVREAEEAEVFEALAFEFQGKKRPQFLDRLRTKYNKCRAYRELKEMEDFLNTIINLNFI